MVPVRYISDKFCSNSSAHSEMHLFQNGLFSIAAIRQPSDLVRINSLLEKRFEAVLKREENKSFPTSVTEVYPLVGGLATVWQELTETGYVSSFVDAFIDESRWRSEWKNSYAQILMRERLWLPNGLPAIPDTSAAQIRSRLTAFRELSDSDARECLRIRSTSDLSDVSLQAARSSVVGSPGSVGCDELLEYRHAVDELLDLVASQSESVREAQEDEEVKATMNLALQKLIETPPKFDEALELFASAVRVRDQAALVSGHESLAALELAASALGEFEESKGRLSKGRISKGRLSQNLLDTTALNSSPVVGVLRAMWKKVMHPLSVYLVPGRVAAWGKENVVEALARPVMSLRKTLQGFAFTAKGLLGLDVLLDSEQDLFTSSSFALRVERRGILLGRVFAEISPVASADAFMLPARCRTRNSGPGIVLASLHCLEGEVKIDNSDMRIFLNTVQLSSSNVKTLFHELAHALHCLASDVLLPTSTVVGNYVDFVELPSHLFEYFGRDWIDFISGTGSGVSGTPSPLYPAFLPITRALFLVGAVRTIVRLHDGSDVAPHVDVAAHPNWTPRVDLASLLDDDDWNSVVPANIYEGVVRASVMGFRDHPFGHILAQPIAAMIYSHGHYREKLFGIFQKAHSVSADASAPAVDDTLSWSSSVEALSGEDGLRQFFQLGGSRVSFSTFFAIVPGLEKRLNDAEFLEDAIDFDPWIEELTRGTS